MNALSGGWVHGCLVHQLARTQYVNSIICVRPSSIDTSSLIGHEHHDLGDAWPRGRSAAATRHDPTIMFALHHFGPRALYLSASDGPKWPSTTH